MTPKVLVLGGNFAGLTAALSVKQELGDDVDVTVVSKSDRFQFNPSFIWIPFGKRKAKDVVFRLAKTFESRGVEFVHGEATKIDPKAQKVETSQGSYAYDYLVIATGYLNDFDVVPGLGPDGNAYSITSLEGAVDAAEGWARFVNDPGPVVVGATQGAACFGAAYEFVFNVAYQLKKQKLKVPVSYVSAEPFAGHFGIGGLPGGEKMLGMFFKHANIDGIFDVAMEEIVPGEVRLTDGKRIPFRYAMVVPPFVGAEVVNASGLGNPKGFIEVKDTYQTLDHPERLRGGDRRGRQRPVADRERGRRAQDGVPCRDDGARRGDEHRVADQRGGTDEGGVLRRHPRGVHHGRGQQRGRDPCRQDASATQTRRDDPRPAEPRGEDRVREVLPVEDEERVREASIDRVEVPPIQGRSRPVPGMAGHAPRFNPIGRPRRHRRWRG